MNEDVISNCTYYLHMHVYLDIAFEGAHSNKILKITNVQSFSINLKIQNCNDIFINILYFYSLKSAITIHNYI